MVKLDERNDFSCITVMFFFPTAHKGIDKLWTTFNISEIEAPARSFRVMTSIETLKGVFGSLNANFRQYGVGRAADQMAPESADHFGLALYEPPLEVPE